MEDEDTGEPPTCTICGAPENVECGHLLACFDRTFGELGGGALYERDGEFRQIIQKFFWNALVAGADISWSNAEIQTAWTEAKSEYDASEGMTEDC